MPIGAIRKSILDDYKEEELCDTLKNIREICEALRAEGKKVRAVSLFLCAEAVIIPMCVINYCTFGPRLGSIPFFLSPQKLEHKKRCRAGV